MYRYSNIPNFFVPHSLKKRKIVKFLKSAQQPYLVYKRGIIRLLLKVSAAYGNEYGKVTIVVFC